MKSSRPITQEMADLIINRPYFSFLAARGLSSSPLLILDRIFSAVHGLDPVRSIGLLGYRYNTKWNL